MDPAANVEGRPLERGEKQESTIGLSNSALKRGISENAPRDRAVLGKQKLP